MHCLALFPTFLESPRGLEILGLFFWIWMICDCLKRERGTPRILWACAILLLPFLGALAYFFSRVLRLGA